jgi:hypothetical protein
MSFPTPGVFRISSLAEVRLRVIPRIAGWTVNVPFFAVGQGLRRGSVPLFVRTLTIETYPPSIAGQTQNLAATHRFLSRGEARRKIPPLIR